MKEKSEFNREFNAVCKELLNLDHLTYDASDRGPQANKVYWDARKLATERLEKYVETPDLCSQMKKEQMVQLIRLCKQYSPTRALKYLLTQI